MHDTNGSGPPPTAARHQVLADPTGSRRRRFALAGRVATAGLGLWLVVLVLGGLGLQPIPGLPIVGDLGTGDAAPPALPERIEAAVKKRTVVGVTSPAGAAAPALRPTATPAPTTSRPLVRRAPTRTTATTGRPTRTTPGSSKLPGPAPATSNRPTTSPSATAPGQTKTTPGHSGTAPGQTRTTQGPPTTTPGKKPAPTPTPAPTPNAHGGGRTKTTP